MIISVESIFPSYTTKEMPSEELRFLLTTLAAQLSVDVAGIFEVQPVTRQIDLLAAERFGGLDEAAQKTALARLAERISAVSPTQSPTIEAAGDGEALFYPFTVTDSITGVLALYATRPSTYT